MINDLALSMAQRVDQACDQFEVDWRSGKRPRIEDLIASVSGEERAALLRGLLLVELELLSARGQTPALDDYRRRFPRDSAVIEQAFAEGGSAEATLPYGTPAVDTSRIGDLPARQSKPLPETLGRFRLLEILGEGAFGTVCKAHDPQLDRDVAIKVPREGTLQSEADRQRFLREARAAAGLSHPNICRVHEVGETDGRDYLVMELLAGKPLSAFIERGNVQPRQAAMVVRKLALALEEAHGKGIVHRDLKPANVMINSRGEPIIMDFGLARLNRPGDAQLTASGVIMGSPAYMSPEQARGATDDIGPASDIYSLGVILYELLCGRRPFEGTVTEVIGQILHVEPAAPSQHKPQIDPALQAICQKAMSKQPSDRYGSMHGLAAELTQYLRATTETARPGATAAEVSVERAPQVEMDTLLAPEQRSLGTRAVHEAVRQARPPRWAPLMAAGLIGTIVLLGVIIFLARTPSAVVTIVVEGVDLQDATLSFLLDDKPVVAEALAVPVELKVGEHELLVKRGATLVKRMLFTVRGGRNPGIEYREIGDPTPAIAAGADRQAAEHLGRFGPLRLALNKQEQFVDRGGKLPQTEFQLLGVVVESNDRLQDADLAPLANLAALRELKLVDCRSITDAGLAHVSGLPSLQWLVLQNAQISDRGLEGLKGVANLQVLSIGGTDVSDAGLAHLRPHKNLSVLDIGRTRITDAGLAHVSGLTHLVDLALYDNAGVTDAGLAHLQPLADLQILQLQGTKVTDAGMSRLKGFTQLEHLNLCDTGMTDAGLAAVAAMPRLQRLLLARSHITDLGLDHLQGLTRLQQLSLLGTQVTDASVPLLARLTSLKQLDLLSTKVSREGVQKLQAALPQCHIDADPAEPGGEAGLKNPDEVF